MLLYVVQLLLFLRFSPEAGAISACWCSEDCFPVEAGCMCPLKELGPFGITAELIFNSFLYLRVRIKTLCKTEGRALT